MPWTPIRPWLPIGVYRTFPLAPLPILKPLPYKPYASPKTTQPLPNKNLK